MFDLKKTRQFLYDISTTATRSGARQAHMLADGGPTEKDKQIARSTLEQYHKEEQAKREAAFPVEVLRVGLRASIERGEATRAEDKTRILNTIAARTADLDAEYPRDHPAYAVLDAQLRSLVAVAAWPKAAKEAGLVQRLNLPALLKADHKRTTLVLCLRGCQFANDAEIADGLSGLTCLTTLDRSIPFHCTCITSMNSWKSMEPLPSMSMPSKIACTWAGVVF